MNFDVYKINKIFYDHISSLPEWHKYGFNYWGKWNDPKFGHYFGIALDSENIHHWLYSFYHGKSSCLKNHYSFYQIDHNHFMHQEEDDSYYFLISEKKAKVSLRELVLFMIYMKYLSNN